MAGQQFVKDEVHLKDMDEQLKSMLVSKWEQAIDNFSDGNEAKCFRIYKAIFHMIEPYDFELKEDLREMTELITGYIRSLGGKPLNMASKIQYREHTIEFNDLVSVYMSMLPKSLAELGLWFKVYKGLTDMQRRSSKENFGSEVSLLGKHKSELLKLDKEEIVGYMKPNHIHECYAHLRFKNAL